MKRILSLLTIIISISLSHAVLMAFYSEGENDLNSQDETRLIIKLDADIKINPIISKSGTATLGLKSFDQINQSYNIRSHERLFKSSEQSALPKSLQNVIVVEIPSNADMNELITEYQKLDEVRYIQPDFEMELYDFPDDPLYFVQWPLNNFEQGYYHVLRGPLSGDDTLVIEYGTLDSDIDFQEVYDNPPDNTSTVVVAIIDTGVDMDHPELAGRIWTNQDEIPGNSIDDDNNGYIDDVNGWDYTGITSGIPPLPDNDPTDEHGHGTHCAGIVTAIAGNGIGISGIVDNCEIMPLKFYPVMLSSYAAEAIIYAADNGADVINMSFGYPWPVQVLEDALTYARSKGVVLCAASGNDEDEYANYPAACPGVITVGASTSSDQIAFFSTYGNHLNISAPGYSILSLRGDSTDMYGPSEANVHIIDDFYYIASGTSMASPHVVGATAYLRAVSPGLTPEMVQDILEQTADDIVDPYGLGESFPGWDKYSGHGRLNLFNALAAVPALRTRINDPQPNQVLSGIIDINGTADGDDFSEYILEYGSGHVPSSWTELINSSTPVTDGLLGTWNTSGLNGTYSIRVRQGESNISNTTIHISNTMAADILSPLSDDTITAWTSVIGNATCSNFKNFTIQFGSGSSPSSWDEITNSSIPVVDNQLAVWNVGDLSSGTYTLKLSLYSHTGLEAEDTRLVYVQSPFSGQNGWELSFSSRITNIMNYGDFNNDGNNEIIIGTEDSLFFVSPDGSLIESGMPALPQGDYRIPAAVGFLNNDGVDDFVIAYLEEGIAKMSLYYSGDIQFTTTLPSTPNLESLNGDLEYLYPSVFLKDIDNDEKDEIFYYNDSRCYIYNPDGSFLHEIPALGSSGNRHFLSADIDNNGIDEFYMLGNVLYQSDISGSIQHSYNIDADSEYPFFSRALSAVDVDNDGKLELIAFGRFYGSTGNYWIYVFDENLALKPDWPRDSGINCFLVPPNVIFGDLDLDDSMEYFISFYELVQATISAWHIDGTPVNGDSTVAILATSNDPGKMYSSILGDVNGDSQPDLIGCISKDVYQTYTAQRIVAWDGTGQMLNGWPLTTLPDGQAYSNSGNHTPSIGDINNDGYVDIIMTTAKNNLVYINYPGASFNMGNTPVPFWRYNRSMNSVKENLIIDCGDCNSDGTVNVSDAVALINYIFVQGSPPNPLENGDTNCDSNVNISDAVWIVNFIFLGGNDPCDPSGDGVLDC